MDLTSLMSALLSDNSINSVTGKTGAKDSDAAGVLAAALPTLLNGANQQASQPETAESFHEAVLEHAAKDPEKVDLAEGEKIVDHLLGDDADKAEKAIAKKTGLSKAQVALILAAAAPLIMNKLGNHTASNNSTSSAATASLLGSLLGGGSNSSASNALMTAALGAVLSGALGGNSKPQQSAGLLGSLLGASQPQVQVQPASSSILGSVLGSALGASQQQQVPVSTGTASLLGSLLGNTQQQPQIIQQAKPQQSSGLDLLGGLMGLLK